MAVRPDMFRALLAVLLFALAGCSGTATLDTPSAVAVPTTVPVVIASTPTAVTIPAIDAHSTLIPLDLDASGALATPDVHTPLQAGWYAGGVVPGAIGPAVIAGHVDGEIGGKKGQPGIFYRLRELKPGDEVLIDRASGPQLRFRVDRTESYPKTAFPTAAVYGDVAAPELRLVTCDGVFDHAARSYENNLVVFASLEV